MPETTIVLKSDPGIKRDGTKYEGNAYVDGQWVRWQRGLPRKIGGFRAATEFLPDISRGVTNINQGGFVFVHSGSPNALSRFTIDVNYNSSSIRDRTPTTLVNDTANKWMFDYQYDSSTSANSLLAHVAPNNSYTTNDLGGQFFYGDAFGTAALTEIAAPAGANFAGGIVSLHPYLFYYGANGIIGWSVAGDFTDLIGAGSGVARVWGTKIIKGMPLRAGSGTAPAGLFWAYDAIIRASFTGDTTVFQFDIIATETSIMSPDSVVDYDGIFFWVGVDRFLMFNGVVREVPNLMNSNYFFDGLNQQQRQKVFGFKVPRFGEIWWCYPKGDATECTHAIIYNVREQSWYDTKLPNAGRTAGTYSNLFTAPLVPGLDEVGPTDYHVWIHEKGVDQIYQNTVLPIESYFETGDLSSLPQGQSQWVRVSMIEPDFVQVGDMTVQVTGRTNARSPEVYGTTFTFPDVADAPYQQVVMTKEQRRELRFKFSSNVINGDYQMGQIIVHTEIGDKTVIG